MPPAPGPDPREGPARWVDETWQDRSRFGLRAHRVLHEGRTRFQEVLLLENEAYGRTLVLDGIFQTCEADEAYYHELLVHPAMCSVPTPRRVLVIGGGDGGTAREVLRHPEVEACVMVEIDREVVELCRRHLPRLGAGAWEDPRLDLRFADGVAFVAEAEAASFDVVLVDGSDPVGPAAGLFDREFFGHVARVLGPAGVLGLQSESFFLTDELFFALQRTLREVFPQVHPYLGAVPLYGTGYWTWTLAGAEVTPASLVEARARRIEPGGEVYGPALHRAAFVLPAWVRRRLAGAEARRQRPGG